MLLTTDTLTQIVLTGSELTSASYIEEDGNWYAQSGSLYVPLMSNKKKNLKPIDTGLESI